MRTKENIRTKEKYQKIRRKLHTQSQFLQFAPHCVKINDGQHVLYIARIARIGKIESITQTCACKISKGKWEFQAAQLLFHYTDSYSRTPVSRISAVFLYIHEVRTYVQIMHIYTFAAHYINVSFCSRFFIDECRYLHAVLPNRISHRYF